MVIPKSERTPTPSTEFFDKALDLYYEAIQVCKNNFGVELKNDKMYWFIKSVRSKIIFYMDAMLDDLNHAHKTYILTKYDYNIRRGYMNSAISNIDTAKKICQIAQRELKIKTSRFTVFIDLSNKVIDTIKNWRKSDNKILPKLENS